MEAVTEKQGTVAWLTLPGTGTPVLSIIEVWGEPGDRHSKIRWVPDRHYRPNQVNEMVSLLVVVAYASNGMSIPKSKRRSPFAIGQRWSCSRIAAGKPPYA